MDLPMMCGPNQENVIDPLLACALVVCYACHIPRLEEKKAIRTTLQVPWLIPIFMKALVCGHGK
jgi:hypothetical protein